MVDTKNNKKTTRQSKNKTKNSKPNKKNNSNHQEISNIEQNTDIVETDFNGQSLTAINNNTDLSTLSNQSEILSQYIKQIANFPMLSQEEENKLFNLYIDKGDQKAGQAIVLSHLRHVVKIAMQYKNFGLNMMDMIAEGNTGLMIALKKFDRTKNARFSTYAGLWAKAKIQEFILKSWSLIKVGSAALRKQLLFNFSGIKKMLKIDSNTSQQEQDKKMAKYFGISDVEYGEAVNAIKNKENSLEAPLQDNEKMTLSDTLSYDNNDIGTKIALKEEMMYRNKVFHESLSILDERQKEIIVARYLKDTKATLDDLSKKYHISKERVRQIEESAIRKLKQFAEKYNNK